MRRQPSINRHHILYNRVTWESNPTTRELRDNPCLIVPVEVETHRELHRSISIVPLLDPYMSGRVARDFVGVPGNALKSMDLLAMSIERAMEHEKANELDYRLGELAVDALLGQREFIRVGLAQEAALRVVA